MAQPNYWQSRGYVYRVLPAPFPFLQPLSLLSLIESSLNASESSLFSLLVAAHLQRLPRAFAFMGKSQRDRM